MENNVYPHDNFVKARRCILASLRTGLVQMMIFLIGVSRVGKTKLLEDLPEHLPDSYDGKVVFFEVPAKSSITYTNKPFLVDYLICLGDVFAGSSSRSYSKMTNHELIQLIVRRVKQCGIKLVIVDEANRFVDKLGYTQVYENLQFLKSLTNLTGIPHIFAGTPTLGQFLGLEGQIINRAHVVRLAPYNSGKGGDIKKFKQVLNEFEKEIEVPIHPALKANPVALFNATNGCVGAIRELLIKLNSHAIEFEQEAITAELLGLSGFYDPDTVRKEEIELFYKQSKHHLVNDDTSKKKSKTKTQPGAKSKRRRPGVRKNPVDKVGPPL